MNEMTLSSRHRIHNSSPGSLRPSTLPLGHGVSPQYPHPHVDGEEFFCFFQTAETGNRAPKSGVKGSGADHYPRAPALNGLGAGPMSQTVGQPYPFIMARAHVYWDVT